MLDNMKKKKALITGITGQDGAYLAKLLLDKNYEVIGGARRSASGELWRLDKLGIKDKVKVVDFELTDFRCMYDIIKELQPDELYNLAAMSFVGASFKAPISTYITNGLSVAYICDIVSSVSPQTKVYQASTSEMFGKVQEIPQKETTPFYPRSPYGVAKLNAYWAVVNYREAYNVYGCNGILFNHESPLRGSEFVTKKIVEYVGNYKKGLVKKPLELGNMHSKRDWGFAGDYVEGMYLMLQQEMADDFVLATGQTHEIIEFVQEAFKVIGAEIKWEGTGIDEVGKSGKDIVVKVNPEFFRPAEVELLIGDYSKAKKVLGWEPKTKFNELVKLMVEAELS